MNAGLGRYNTHTHNTVSPPHDYALYQLCEVELLLQSIGCPCYRRPRCRCESDGAHTTRITGIKPRPYPLVATEKQRYCMGVLPHGVHRELGAVKQALYGLHRNNRQMTTINKSLVVALEAPHWSVSRPRNPVVARASLR